MRIFEKDKEAKQTMGRRAGFLTQLLFKDWDHTALVAAKRAALLYTWTCLVSDASFKTGLFPNNPGTISIPPCSKKGDSHKKRDNGAR